MVTVILAGGRGTRLSEETQSRPKPMVEIGGRPILWHLMHYYATHGHRDCLVACGSKGELIKQYFSNFLVHNDDYTIDLKSGSLQVIHKNGTDWRVNFTVRVPATRLPNYNRDSIAKILPLVVESFQLH